MIRIIPAGLLVLFFPAVALASGITVAPAEINLKTGLGRTAGIEITIMNPESDTQDFELYPDDYRSTIEISPAKFRLASEGQQKVLIVSQANSESTIKTNISVVATPVTKEMLTASAGVKVPFELQIRSGVVGSLDWIDLGILAFVFLGSLGLVSVQPDFKKG